MNEVSNQVFTFRRTTLVTLWWIQFFRKLIKPFTMDALRLPDISPRTLFTKREKEVLELVTSGLSTKEIASRLSVDVQTINTHRKRMMKKLHVKNIHGVICFGFVNGILDINVIKELMTHQTYGFSPKSIDRSIN